MKEGDILIQELSEKQELRTRLLMLLVVFSMPPLTGDYFEWVDYLFLKRN